MSDQEILSKLIFEIEVLKQEQKRFAAQQALYTILNANLPAQLTANQNDYDPGNYDVLFMNSNASRNVTGISGGALGRSLLINTFGANNIVLIYNSVLSQPINRISTPTAADLTITPRHSAWLVHTGTIWNVVLYV